jgi:hypothetical protein
MYARPILYVLVDIFIMGYLSHLDINHRALHPLLASSKIVNVLSIWSASVQGLSVGSHG